MLHKASGFFEFGNYRIDLSQRVLLSGTEVVPLAPKTFDMLLALVETNGRIVEKEELLQKIWPETFVEEGSLARSISTLRKALGENSDDQKYIQTVPKRGYRFVAQVRLVPAVPNSLVVEERARVRTTFEVHPAEPEAPVTHIAVLPFLSMSAEPDNQYFSEGLAEELIHALNQVQGLRVVARTSSFLLSRRNLDISQIGKQLKVGSVVEGSVRRAGDRLRIAVQLVSVDTGHHLWSSVFDRHLVDAFAVQEEIAIEVCRVLRIRLQSGSLRGSPLRPPVVAAAIEPFLRGRYFWIKGRPQDLRKGIKCFQQAISADPAYAEAYTGLAMCYIYLAYLGASIREVMPLAKTAVYKALELDGSLPEAHQALGAVLGCERDLRGSTKELELAAKIDAQLAAKFPCWHLYLVGSGQFERALDVISRDLENDPLSLVLRSYRGLILYSWRRYEEALEQLESALDLDPDYYAALWFRGLTQGALGQNEFAAESLQRAIEVTGNFAHFSGFFGCFLATAGKTSKAECVLHEIEQRSRLEYISSVQPALIYLGLGRMEEALGKLHEAAGEGSFLFNFLGSWPLFDGLRDHPGYGALLQKLWGAQPG